MDVYYIDGEFVPADRAAIPVNDLAVLRGFGVFDFLRTYGGRPFHLRDHLKRLHNSAEQIGLNCPWTEEELEEIVRQTLMRNRHEESNIRIVVTGGPSEDFITPGATPRLIVMVSPLVVMPVEWYTQGVKIITASLERLMPGAKSIDYIPAILALRRAATENAVEAVYLDGKNHVMEGTTSNLFMFDGEKFLTPDRGVLGGITRKVVLELVQSRFPLEKRDILLTELLTAEELFLCSSNKEVMPVVKVDDAVVGSGKPGRNTAAVMDLFAEYTQSWAAGSTSQN
jgi:branched-chain amino acid aminotransferase